MVTLIWLIFCSVFVYNESTSHKSKPRAVNLALETVIEFDNKDRAYDLKFIDQVQGFLNKVKYVLKKDQNYRRSGKPELKFSDFIRSTLAIINTYDDEDVAKFLKIFNEEARKFNYRGCKFHELVQNTSFRRYVGKKLDELKEMPLEEVRDRIDELLKTWNEGKLSEQNEQLINYLDSLYEDDASERIAVVLHDLDLYRNDQKQRSSIDLFDTVRKGLRSLVFDHYTNLKAKERNDVRLKLESAWTENAEENSHNIFNSYLSTDMNRFVETEFEATTIKESKFKPSNEEEDEITPHVSNEESTIKSHDSDEYNNDEATKELKKEKSTSSSSESDETKSSIKNKKKTSRTSHDDMAKEFPAATTQEKVELLSIESKEMTTTKKKHKKQRFRTLKETTTKIELKTTASIQSSIEKAPKRNKRLKFKASREHSISSDDEDKRESHNVTKEKTTKFQLKTTAAMESSIEKAPENKRIKKASHEYSKSSDNEDEVSSTAKTTKIKKHIKEKTESETNNPEIKVNTKKDKSKTKKHSKKKVNNNSDGNVHNNVVTVVTNSTALTDDTTNTTKQKKKRKSKTEPTHEPHHAVAFRNFDLSDQDTSDTKVPRSTTESTLATDDMQESSDYEVTKKSRKSFTTPASNEGMSIESFEAHKSNVRKSNNDDSFLPKQQVIKEIVPDALLSRLSQLEKELKAVKSQITVATKKETKLSVEKHKQAFDTLAFWEGTSKILVNEKKDTNTSTHKTTQKYETKSSHIAKTTKINNNENSVTAEFKVITRDRTATTKTFFKHTTKSESLLKGTTGRITKTIKFDSPSFRAITSDNDQPKIKEASDRKIFISVENEAPNATYEFQVPFNFSNTSINYEVEVVKDAESTVSILKHTLNATNGKIINEMNNNKTAQQDLRSGMPNLLHDENNDVNDEFDPEDLLIN